jgi:ribosomal-protein-alanine N-acetyltransferase
VVTTPRPTVPSIGARTGWRAGLPTLSGSLVTIRELREADGLPLFAQLTTDEVTRFISPPPTTVDRFERFIERMRDQRAGGDAVGFAIVPRGADTPVGLFQVRALEPGFANAEWGFAMASRYWGTGFFVEGARFVADFAFDVIGAERLEARAAVADGRGNAALGKIGAVPECVLRGSFFRHGRYHDQMLWTILRDDWRESKGTWDTTRVIH